VGRDTDLESLDDTVRTTRLCTVLGPPGAGKTRLAQRYAHLRARDFPGGAWFCDLGDAGSLDELVSAVAGVLGVSLQAESTAGAPAALGAAIAARGELLLVLDELEHVTAHASVAVAAWLHAAPALRVLGTSRERLGLAGETLFDLGPLTLPDDAADLEQSDAVRLFVERARAVRRGYTIGEHDAPHVVELVSMLDGLPLAIELAAARMRVLSPAQLCEHLGERFSLLTESPAQTGRKQLTLRASIEASWRLLTPWEQTALAQCSVFRGGFGVEAATAVLALPAGSPAVLDVLAALRDRSLLGAYEPASLPGSLRYAVLHSIRDFAAAELRAAGAEQSTFARHADHFASACSGLADALDGADAKVARRRLALEAHNLLAVHQRALAEGSAGGPTTRRASMALLAIDPVLEARAPRSMRLRLLDDALAFAAEPEVRARALEARTQVGASRLETDVDRALSLADTTADPTLVGRLLGGLGNVLVRRGELDRAARVYERALALERKAGDHAAEAGTRRRLDEVLARLGRRESEPPAPQASAEPEPASTDAALVVSTSGRWFRAPGAAGVSLRRRGALRLVLKCLADQRERAPGVALGIEELLAAGWPGQKVHPVSGASRVYNALSSLRSLGVRDLLLSRDDGYLFDPAVSIARIED
jgi:predicted ATPase